MIDPTVRERSEESKSKPDSAEWWREVAQGLGVEIHKLKQAGSPRLEK